MFKARPSFLSPRPAAIACLAFIAALSNPSAGHAAEANATNWYFSPHLTEDCNPALCHAAQIAVMRIASYRGGDLNDDGKAELLSQM